MTASCTSRGPRRGSVMPPIGASAHRADRVVPDALERPEVEEDGSNAQDLEAQIFDRADASPGAYTTPVTPMPTHGSGSTRSQPVQREASAADDIDVHELDGDPGDSDPALSSAKCGSLDALLTVACREKQHEQSQQKEILRVRYLRCLSHRRLKDA